jgi:hypothetical protein
MHALLESNTPNSKTLPLFPQCLFIVVKIPVNSFCCVVVDCHSWAQVPTEKKQELIGRKLWITANMAEFRSDMKREYFAAKKKR